MNSHKFLGNSDENLRIRSISFEIPRKLYALRDTRRGDLGLGKEAWKLRDWNLEQMKDMKMIAARKVVDIMNRSDLFFALRCLSLVVVAFVVVRACMCVFGDQFGMPLGVLGASWGL